MEITDGAKEIIMKILTDHNADCLEVSAVAGGCGGGTSLRFGLATLKEEDKPITANGVSMIMEDAMRDRVEKLVISSVDGALNIIDAEASSCSSCSSCS